MRDVGERAEVLSWKEQGHIRQTCLGEVENCFQVENNPENSGWNWRVKSECTKREGKCH